MALVKTNGSLYFLRDKDYLTGDMGRYVKIGIVRKDKSTEKRIKEHQTGNPRDIIDVHTISGVPFVEKLETLIHYRFNEKWITGEWFDLNDKELKVVIKEANRMKDEQLLFESVILKTEKLSTAESNGTTRPATAAEENLRDEYIAKLKRTKELEAHLLLIRAEFCQLLGKKHGKIKGVLDMIFTTDSLSFDTSGFKSAYPSFHDKYSKSETEEKIKETFEIIGEKNAALSKWNKPLEDQKKKIPKEDFDRSQENSELARNKKIESLHSNHLALQKELTLLQWELELIKYQLKAAVDKDEKIEGVCSWKRTATPSTSTKFDEENFKKDHPALYLAHYKVKQGHHKINIHGHRSYRPR
jgi:hypothetical protein